ncbi:hypothetical protein O6H91_03G010900 [Diphasiastrum complanatum]|uniref:Uncharacterized protein n=1 Tax=Diphasiastrum complanatum TaxID=34168 RepID=A0ACC2E3D4_DIPCM|nr:hypothetical protein O6H91_03G010900 [Diphasiastrum complanatum]
MQVVHILSFCCRYAGKSNGWSIRRSILVIVSREKSESRGTLEEIFLGSFTVVGSQGNFGHPDFKHKKSREALWIDAMATPEWVKVELAIIKPGTIQSSMFSWNIKLGRYVKDGQDQKALELYRQMQVDGAHLNKFTFIPAIKACSNLAALEEGICIHSHIIKSGCDSDIFVGSCLVDMYSKCGSVKEAFRVFNNMPTRDIVSWSGMIGCCVKAGQGEKALQLFQQMQLEGLEPDRIAYVGLLNACASLGALEEGRRIHELIIQSRCNGDIVVGNSLINMYVKCGSLEDACTQFNNMSERDVVTWSTFIGGYANCGQGEKALKLFEQMHQHHSKPDRVTFLAVLNACAATGALEEGRCAHSELIQNGWHLDVVVGSCLIDMYCKCKSLPDAWKVFNSMSKENVVAWNAMITGLVKCEEGKSALELYKRMQQEQVQPDKVTFLGVLNACASLSALQEGREVHAQVRQRRLESELTMGSCLIDMYSKCGSIEDACLVFDNMRSPDVVSWSAMIAGHVKYGQGARALQLFSEMQQRNIEPSSVTFIAALNACASLAALDFGKSIHEQILQRQISYVFLWNCLIDMYCKCGSIDEAYGVFDSMPNRDEVSWTTMLGGYAMHGLGKEALALHEQMCLKGLKLDAISFVCLLSACSHAGLVDEGQYYFTAMFPVYGVAATAGHYGCIVDVLGRAGWLDEAEDIIRRMPFQPTVSILITLLAACRIHGNMEMGESIAKQVIQVDPENARGYVLLSNVYTATGKLDYRAKVHDLRKKRNVHKQPGCSWIEVGNRVHTFLVDDKQHPQSREIRKELNRLCGLLTKAGYIPDTSLLLHDDGEEEEDDFMVCPHSEKLAIAYGLMSTPSGTSLRILKNLRVCADCHSFTKFVSKVVGRELIVRDASRFHHFKDGACSCKDYW